MFTGHTSVLLGLIFHNEEDLIGLSNNNEFFSLNVISLKLKNENKPNFPFEIPFH